jgi:hypothetical protein
MKIAKQLRNFISAEQKQFKENSHETTSDLSGIVTYYAFKQFKILCHEN